MSANNFTPLPSPRFNIFTYFHDNYAHPYPQLSSHVVISLSSYFKIVTTLIDIVL